MRSIALDSPPAIEPRYLRMSAPHVRSAIYAFIGSLVLAATVVWVNRFRQAPIERCWIALVFPLLGFGLLVFVLRWRMRLDAQGIAVTGLFGMHNWTWDDMLAGQVKLKSLLRFEQDRWVGRTLSLELLAPADAHYVSRLCRLACVHASLPDTIPAEVTFCDEWNRRVRCTVEGIRLPSCNQLITPWSAIVHARMVRATREANDFLRLELQLGERKIVANAVQQWSVRG